MRSGPRYKHGAELIGFTRIRVDRLIWHHAGGANLERHCRRTGSELGFVGTRCAQSCRSTHPDSSFELGLSVTACWKDAPEGCEIFWPIVVKRTDGPMNRALSVASAGRHKLKLPVADPAKSCLGVL